MKKLFSTLLIALLATSLFLSISCKNDKDMVKEEYEDVKTELDKIKGIQTDSNEVIEKLKAEIKSLEIEKQRLIAEKKRLEAEIIDLKIKDYEKEDTKPATGDKKK